MLKRIAALGLLALVLATAALGSAALRPAAQPSGPIQAVPVEQRAPDPTAGAAAPTSSQVYQIQPGVSTARFIIDEILRGSPETVIGRTDQMSGEIALDLAQPADAQVGTIIIGARSLVTDDNQRNRVLANLILSTSQYEYITFKPTDVSGLPPTVALGQPYMFQIDGDLTIRDVTKPASFTATVTPVTATQLQGTASTSVRYADWGIAIPQVPAVAGVGDVVDLQIDFTATASA
jgi:polyisoprenoid-binding protein YceI